MAPIGKSRARVRRVTEARSGPRAGSSTQYTSDSLILGLDEAGRGSLIGPLVVGGFALRADRLDSLVAAGVRDSKQLSPERRETVYAALGRLGRRFSVPLPPSVVDAHVRRGRLNHLEAEVFGRLVRRAGPSAVYVDACDPVAERFGREVLSWARLDIPIVSEHRADETYPVVAAASIVAKVRRDRAVARLRSAVGERLGSGYPSDELTCAFVREILRTGAPAPPWVRQSWRTMRRLKPRPVAPTLESFHR